MDIKTLQARINSAQMQADNLKKSIESDKQKIAEILCPFEVGQEVITPQGEERIVAEILPSTI